METTAPKCIVIPFYAHKGGVGKTTDIHNFGCMLANTFNLRVLLIDGDPQCSLTGSVMHKKFREIGKGGNPSVPEGVEAASYWAEKGEDKFYQDSKNSSKRETFYQCMIKGAVEDISSFTESFTMTDRLREINLQTFEEFPNLRFLPGDIDLNLIEQDAARGLSTGPNDVYWQQVPVAISQWVRKIGDCNDVDIVLVDLNPGATALNASLVMGSDYFIIPNLPDYYSRRSIGSVHKVLDIWNENWENIRKNKKLKSSYTISEGPKLLGYTFNRVKFYQKKPTQDHQIKIDKINTEIVQVFKLDDQNQPSGGFKTENFQICAPSLIKEFTRTFHKAGEVGDPLTFTSHQNMLHPKANLRKEEADEDSEAAKESFFFAILVIFRNLSNEHHLRLNNLFNPNYTHPFLIPDSQNIPSGLYGTLDNRKIFFEIPRAAKISVKKEQVLHSLRHFHETEWRKKKSLLLEEIKTFSKNAGIDKLRREITDLYRDLRALPNVNLINVFKFGLNSEEDDVIKYVQTVQNLKLKEVELNKKLKEDNALEHYIKNIEEHVGSPIPIGPEVLKIYTKYAHKSLIIWRLIEGNLHELQVSEKIEIDQSDSVIHILLKDKVHFEYLEVTSSELIHEAPSAEDDQIHETRKQLKIV